jgi:hypothetical protein
LEIYDGGVVQGIHFACEKLSTKKARIGRYSVVNRGVEDSCKVTYDVTLICFVIISLLFLSSGNPILAANTTILPPGKGAKLPGINLPIPKNLDEKNYLGLSGQGLFKIPQIRAEGVLVQIFNTYCPICQAAASAMGELYRQIENNPGLKDKIKLIGIGVGNNTLETEIFKQTYHIPFPIFPDENYEIHKALGEVRTPFHMALKINRGGYQEIVYTHLGGLTDARGFLDLMAEAYGIKQEDLLIRKASSPIESLSTLTP